MPPDASPFAPLSITGSAQAVDGQFLRWSFVKAGVLSDCQNGRGVSRSFAGAHHVESGFYAVPRLVARALDGSRRHIFHRRSAAGEVFASHCVRRKRSHHVSRSAPPQASSGSARSDSISGLLRSCLLRLRYCCLAVLVLCLIAKPQAAIAQTARPNFIVVVTDDQRYDALSVVQKEQGDKGRYPWLTTPNMDRSARRAVPVFSPGNTTTSTASSTITCPFPSTA